MFGLERLIRRSVRLSFALLALLLLFTSSRRASYSVQHEDPGQRSRRPRPARQDIPSSPLRSLAALVSASGGKEPPLSRAELPLDYPGFHTRIALPNPVRRCSELTKPEYLQFYLSSLPQGELSPPA